VQEQYQFVYDVVSMFLQCGRTVFAATDMPALVRVLSQPDDSTGLSGFETEFEVCTHYSPYDLLTRWRIHFANGIFCTSQIIHCPCYLPLLRTLLITCLNRIQQRK
jgi:hypothetical protein